MRIVTSIFCGIVLASCSHIAGPSPLPAGVSNGVSALSAREPLEPSLKQTGPDGASFTHLFSFSGVDGAHPYADLTDVNGTLLGTTSWGGSGKCKSEFDGPGCGTVFKITTRGTQTVLYNFKGYPTDGQYPQGGLTNVNGSLYGTTSQGGDSGCGPFDGCGTVFKTTTSGMETVLYNFKGGTTDGSFPLAKLLDVNGKLYGTTDAGAAVDDGTVFEITTSGTERVLHSFNSRGDGEGPDAGLINVGGVLYSTTSLGGTHDAGVAFKITTLGNERTIYSFKALHGQEPFAGLTDVNGTLYGTTYFGGGHHKGTVFKITAAGTETVLHSFEGGADGAGPVASLTDVNGTLYGITSAGGGSDKCYIIYSYSGCGTIFKITTSGIETVLYGFKGGADGAYPSASLTEVNGTLFGTTSWGGTGKCKATDPYHQAKGCGTVFKVSRS